MRPAVEISSEACFTNDKGFGQPNERSSIGLTDPGLLSAVDGRVLLVGDVL